MRGRGAWRALVPACVIAAVLLAACTSTADPAPSSSPEVAPSPSPSATASSAEPSPSAPPAAPSLPPEAEGRSRAAAKAFVRHYIDLVNYAVSTGRVAELEAAGRDDCSSCESVLERVQSVYSAGGHIRSDGWQVRSINVVHATTTSPVVIDVGIRLSPQVVVEREGARSKNFEGGRLPATFSVVRTRKAWLVSEWERAA